MGGGWGLGEHGGIKKHRPAGNSHRDVKCSAGNVVSIRTVCGVGYQANCGVTW